MANIGQTVTTYRELVQQQVHEEGYFVAVQHVGAVDGAAGARQVVGVDGGAQGPDAEEQKKALERKKGCERGCERLAFGGHWRRLSAVIGQSKHTLPYLRFLKGAVCLCNVVAYLTDKRRRRRPT